MKTDPLSCSCCPRTDLTLYARLVTYFRSPTLGDRAFQHSGPICAQCLLKLALKDIQAGRLTLTSDDKAQLASMGVKLPEVP